MNVVNASVNVVNDVLEHHGDVKLGFIKNRRIPSDILPDSPEDPRIRRLRRAGPENLGAVEPDGGDTIVLIAGGVSAEIEDDARPGRRTIGRWRVRGGERRGVDCVGE